MSQLRNLLQHYNESEEQFVRNVYHFFEEVKLYEYPKPLGFCDPNQQRILSEINKHFDLEIKVEGGYPSAERQSVTIAPSGYQLETNICCFELVYNRKFNRLEHKHIMGTLYNMGISESLIGDIIVSSEGRVQICVGNELRENLPLLQSRYGNTPVQYQLIDKIGIEGKAPSVGIRSSKTLRLDSICKGITHNSRTGMSKEIRKGNVFVNHKQEKDPIYKVGIGDLISIRGYGRAQVIDIIPVNGKYNIKFTTTNHK